MNKTNKGFLLVIFISILMAFALPATASANSAEPPSLIIIVINPPDNLSIESVSTNNHEVATVERVAWEGYYIFYWLDMKVGDVYTFNVTTNGESFECTLSEPVNSYNNVYTLDLSTRELTPGKYPLRSVLLVPIRVLLTLLLEGIIFWLFGFRQKRSWLVFFIVNLITQGVLNIGLNIISSPLDEGLICVLIFGEIFVFIAEIVTFSKYIKEQINSRILIYVIVANLVSLLAGGLLISILPV
jgi:hypothetical protein